MCAACDPIVIVIAAISPILFIRLIDLQADPARCQTLCTKLIGSGDEKSAATAQAFSILLKSETGCHVVDKLLHVTSPAVLHRFASIACISLAPSVFKFKPS